MNKIRKTARVMLGVVLAATIIAPAGTAGRVFAEDEIGVKNPEAVVLDDGVVLSKTAKAVEEKVNTWDVTLKIESASTLAAADTVMIIDTSESMGRNGKIDEAKVAAKILAGKLLQEGNTTNRVALLQYADKVARRVNFTTDYTAVDTAIDKMTTGGGTFTQAAIHDAANLLSTSTADVKNIVLLSDGVPTYNYQINNIESYMIDGGPGNYENEKHTSKDIVQSDFLYKDKKAGDGFTTWGTVWSHLWADDGESWYYNSANCAIAEAGYYKNSNDGDIYTIALNSDDYGKEVLDEIATPGKAYTATVEDLSAVFNQIAGRIVSAVQYAEVHDVMGDGVRIASDSAIGVAGAEDLDWVPEFYYDTTTNKYMAEVTYRVEATDEIINNVDDEGYAPLNKSATIKYGVGKIGDFAVPKAKPMTVNITKILEGQDCDECEFVMELMQSGDVVGIFSLKNGETKIIAGGLTVGDYNIREVETLHNDVDFGNYAVSYSKDGFSIGRDWARLVGPIDIIVTNKYKTADEELGRADIVEPIVVDPCLMGECGKGAFVETFGVDNSKKAAVKAPETGKLEEQKDIEKYSADANTTVAVCGIIMTLLMLGIARCYKGR